MDSGRNLCHFNRAVSMELDAVKFHLLMVKQVFAKPNFSLLHQKHSFKRVS